MVEVLVAPLLAIALGLIAGALGGFMNSVLRWLEVSTPFNAKSNIKAVLVGILAGLGITIASVTVLRESLAPDVLIVQLFIIFIAAAGAQSFTNKISGIVSGEKQNKQPVVPT